MLIYLFALLIGVVAGLRTMTAPTVVSWAAYLGWIHLHGTPLAFLGATVTPYILTVLAIGELAIDQSPKTPSRKAPFPFTARIVSGTLSGAALGASGGAMIGGALIGGAVAGAVGAAIGTLGGYEGRVRLARALGRDMPAGFIEDAVAIGGGLCVVWLAR